MTEHKVMLDWDEAEDSVNSLTGDAPKVWEDKCTQVDIKESEGGNFNEKDTYFCKKDAPNTLSEVIQLDILSHKVGVCRETKSQGVQVSMMVLHEAEPQSLQYLSQDIPEMDFTTPQSSRSLTSHSQEDKESANESYRRDVISMRNETAISREGGLFLNQSGHNKSTLSKEIQVNLNPPQKAGIGGINSPKGSLGIFSRVHEKKVSRRRNA